MTEPKKPANKTKRPAGNTQRPKRKRPAEHAAPAGAKTRRTAPKHTAPAVPRKPRKQRPAWQRGLQRAGSILLTTTLSFLLILVITCTIVGTTLVVYVLGFMEGTSEVSIKEMEMSYSTFIYAEDKDGEIVTLHQVPSSIKRIPIEASEIPQHVRDAFTYAEDERFYEHEGVDYKRTAAAMANMVLHFWSANQGGSTITQQLVKNITGDNATNAERKIREIFRAMQMEKTYTKEEILTAYLNYIGFGGSANGIEMASIKYFGKHTNELTVAEAACLAAIPKNPEKLNPFAYYVDDETGERVNYGHEKNRERQEYVLYQMYSNGAISYDEYQAALAEHIIFTDSEEYKELHPEEDEDAQIEPDKPTSWVVDAAINELSEVLMDKYGISKKEARSRVNRGGYQIYTTVDLEMQEYVESRYQDMNNLLAGMATVNNTAHWRDLNGDGVASEDEAQFLQSGFCAINYSGEILATVGAIGEKTASLCTSYAYEPQQPGSTIKPVTTYGYALSTDYIHWGTPLRDYPPIKNPATGKLWPTNYSSGGGMSYTGSMKNVYYALQKSYNTIPALLCKELGRIEIYNFATNNLGLELVQNDQDYAPLSVGALTYGVSITNLVNAYMVYGNGGYYSKAHIISKVESGDGTLVYSGGTDYNQAVDEETSTVMNKLLQNVVKQGTATAAKITASDGTKIPIAGKTGTTSDWCDLTFVGLCPDFVSGMWIGYEQNYQIQGHGRLKSAGIWKNIIGDYIKEHYDGNDFFVSDSVIEAPMCTASGNIAGSSCPKGITGYWKSTNAPRCTGHGGGSSGTPVTTKPAADN